MRAAPPRSRASGRTASVVSPHAASAVSASAIAPSSSTSRRVRLTRSSTGASELAICSRGSPTAGDVERERAPRRAGDVDRLEAGLLGHLERLVGDVAGLARDVVAVGDLRERAAAAQQHLASIAAAAVRVAGAAQDRVGASAQVGVDLVAAVALDGGQQQRSGEQPADADRGDRGEHDPRAEAAGQPHGRSAQPTPRTVWRMRGSPPPSSLRRR